MKFLFLIFLQSSFAAEQSVGDFVASALKYCDQKISVEVLIPAKRERQQACLLKNNKCQSCIEETTRVVDLYDFPLIQKTDRKQERTKFSCSKAPKENPHTFLEENLRTYRAEFAVMPTLLFTLGIENFLNVYHLKEVKKSVSPIQNLMIEKACPRLLQKTFKLTGILDLSSYSPKLKDPKLAKLSYKLPLHPTERIQRSIVASLLLPDGSIDLKSLKDGDEVMIEGEFKVKTSDKFSPDIPAIREKNTFLYFYPKQITRKQPL